MAGPDTDHDLSETTKNVNRDEEIYQELLNELASPGRMFQVMLPRQYNSLNKYSECTWECPTATASTTLTMSLWSLITDQELSDGVYTVQARGDGSKSVSTKLVIKLAFSTAEKQTLIHEYNCHTALAGEPFAVKAFGVLRFAEQFPSLCGMLMEWAGTPLPKIVGKVKWQKANKGSFSDIAKEQLKALHTSERLTVNSQIHGNLCLEHVLFMETGEVSFISFRRLSDELVKTEKEIEMWTIEQFSREGDEVGRRPAGFKLHERI